MHDVIIIGAGPAGLTAAIYTSRAGLKTLVLESASVVSQASTASHIENYPGFEGISGMELVCKFRAQAEKLGAEFRCEEAASLKEGKNKTWTVGTPSGDAQSLSVIIATGSRPKKLGIPGEESLRGRGVSYCATCDGAFFKNKDVAVIGGGNTAIEEAMFLTTFAKKVTVIHRRDRLRATKIIQERAFANKKIEFAWNSIAKEILGKQKVEGIRVENIKDKSVKEIPCNGVFMLIGYIPNTDCLKGTVSMDERGYVISDDGMKTSKLGIFAAGDARKKLLRQVVTACGEGSVAAVSARMYIDERKGTVYK